MRLKVPPPIIFLVHLLLVWLVSKYLSEASYQFPGQRAVTQVLGTAGVAISIFAMGLFRRASTTVDPLNPQKANKIVNTGIFRVTRNPMYLGLVLILLAWIIWRGNIVATVFLGTCMWYLTEFQIKPEEEALEQKFGAEYLKYKQKVRRWI